MYYAAHRVNITSMYTVTEWQMTQLNFREVTTAKDRNVNSPSDVRPDDSSGWSLAGLSAKPGYAGLSATIGPPFASLEESQKPFRECWD